MNHLRFRRFGSAVVLAVSTLTAAPSAMAQDGTIGQLATSSAGQAGQRQDLSRAARVDPPRARVNNRLQSRIQARIASRIDRNYNPRVDTLRSSTADPN